jgi:SAM-dependent methyltransferase
LDELVDWSDVFPQKQLQGRGEGSHDDDVKQYLHHSRRTDDSCLLLISGFTTNRIAYASTTSKTGILLPSVGEIEASIPSTWDEENDNPLYNRDIKSAFSRLDNTPDTIFYTEPRFVEHVDENAVKTMTSYISTRLLHSGDSVLDLCSSWTSHIDQQQQPQQQQGGGVGETLNLKRVAGLGMNAKELKANTSLTEWTVMDLNTNNIKLPYTDSSFDIVLLQLSIDYLISPLEVLKESSRVLKPNGRIAILFSNRLFLTKAVGLWTGSDDIEHAYTVGGYLHFCDGGFTNIMAEDLSMRQQKGRERVIVGDPLYVVTATKGGLI